MKEINNYLQIFDYLIPTLMQQQCEQTWAADLDAIPIFLYIDCVVYS